MSKQGCSSASARALNHLARAMGKECRGDTAILGDGFPALRELLVAGASPATLVASGPLQTLATRGDGFDTVVLVRVLEYETDDSAVETLRSAWQLLRPGGRLVACVPNEELVTEGAVVQRFTRRGFKHLLQTIDRPRLVSTQPLKWLLMTLDTHQPPSRSARERCNIMATLCRGKVMELGCGPGHLCDAIARRGLLVQGVDKNAGKIAKARELYPEIRFDQADILTLDGKDTYDTVVLAEVLEHVPPDAGERMLAKAWELVAPGGRLVISVPNEDCVRHPNHLQEFDRKALHKLLSPMGPPVTVAEQPFKWLLMYVDRRQQPA